MSQEPVSVLAEPPELSTVESLAARVRSAILHRVLRGRLPPGRKITIAKMAEELAVSPTPVREALIRLTSDGFLNMEANRGFYVRRMSLDEVQHLYQVLSALDELALTLAPVPTGAQLTELNALNADLVHAAGSDPEMAVAINVRWHQALVEHCGNPVLLHLIANLRSRLFRYEYVYYSRVPEEVKRSALLHDGIVEVLQRGDRAKAVKLLRAHWASDLKLMLPRVKKHAAADMPQAAPI